MAKAAFRDQMAVVGEGPYLFPSVKNPEGFWYGFATVWTEKMEFELILGNDDVVESIK
jgi:hypothetical protein